MANKPKANETVAYWRNLARCHIASITPEDAEHLAEQCVGIVLAGGNTSLWHESSRLFGHRCNCVACNPKTPKGAWAYHGI